MPNRNRATRLLVSLLLPFVAAATGGLATASSIPTWYAGLAKPAFNPPNWIFGPVWTALYVLMGASLYLAWAAEYNRGSKRCAFALFGLQLVLNAVWSLVFFGAHWPWGGVLVIIPLLLTIVALIRKFWPISRRAAWLLVPYLLWVGFAAVLNIAIAVIN